MWRLFLSAQEYYRVTDHIWQLHPVVIGDPVKGGLPIEAHMGWIPSVMPFAEINPVMQQAGHDGQPSSPPHQCDQPFELSPGMMKVFDHFRASDKVVIALQNRIISSENRIVDVHFVAAFSQHPRQRRAGPAAEIQPLGSASQSLAEGYGEPIEPVTVAGIGRIVFVQIVMPALRLGIRQLIGIEKSQLAVLTTEIIEALDLGERKAVIALAKWADHRHMLT